MHDLPLKCLTWRSTSLNISSISEAEEKRKKAAIYKDLRNNLRDVLGTGYVNDLGRIIFACKCFFVSHRRIQPRAFLFLSYCGFRKSLEERTQMYCLRRQVVWRQSPSHYSVFLFFSRLPKYRIPFWLHGQIEPRYYLRWGFPREARNNKFHCPLLTLHLGECQHFLAIWKTSPEPSGTPLISKLYLVLYRSHCVIPESFCLGLVCKSPDIFYDSILLPEFHIVVYDGLECQFHFFKRLIHETRRCF